MRVRLTIQDHDMQSLGNIVELIRVQPLAKGWDAEADKDIRNCSTIIDFTKDESNLYLPYLDEDSYVHMDMVMEVVQRYEEDTPPYGTRYNKSWHFEIRDTNIRGDTYMECLMNYERGTSGFKDRKEATLKVLQAINKRKRIVIMGD